MMTTPHDPELMPGRRRSAAQRAARQANYSDLTAFFKTVTGEPAPAVMIETYDITGSPEQRKARGRAARPGADAGDARDRHHGRGRVRVHAEAEGREAARGCRRSVLRTRVRGSLGWAAVPPPGCGTDRERLGWFAGGGCRSNRAARAYRDARRRPLVQERGEE